MEAKTMSLTAPTAAPSLFRVLARQRGWTRWEVFSVHFDRAASDLVREKGLLKPPTVARRTFDRWVSGEWHGTPRPDTALVLHRLFGVPVEELFRAAPEVVRAAALPLERIHLQAAQSVDARWSTSRLSLTADRSAGWHLWELEGRRVFDGTALTLHLETGTYRDGAVRLDATDRLRQFVRPVRRGVVMTTVVDAEDRLRTFVLDARAVRSMLLIDDSTLPVAGAHELDDLTYGLIWAVANADDGLLADDHLLDAQQRALSEFLKLPSSALSKSWIPGITAVGSSWMGSYFCAQHIRTRLAAASDLPMFWTREQFGEEAVGWLLYTHKHAYLRSTEEFASTDVPVTRTFCLPEAAVQDSQPYERLLLFLAAALMEMHHITVRVCTEREFSSVDGFVLVPGQQVVIANWVRSEEMWHASTTTSRSQLRFYTDVAGHASSKDVIAGRTPLDRLQALAAYLRLDWSWLRRRCRALGEQGVSSVIQPRSRLVSIDELDAVLLYVGSLTG
ncbi:transcriptional regulator, XRE family protein [Streptomyces misionensis]|uniref:transcriptional regulator, XRE family protein n=1 Tax=Streptomyces misionensis TaxID=67331 RepID=UPI003427C0A2